MGLIELLLMITVVGFAVYLLTTYVPMVAPFKTAIIVIAVVVLLLLVLRAFGIADVPLR